MRVGGEEEMFRGVGEGKLGWMKVVLGMGW